MIDRSLNYGRHLIEGFLRDSRPYTTVLDIGAGHGDDLLIARSVNPQASLIGLEAFGPYIQELRQKSVEVRSINIERDPFPFPAESLDIILGNQILEHTKEVFWIFDQISRALKV